MRKLIRNVCICLMITVCMWFLSVLSNKEQLRQNLIRFHVVANSDSEWDQNVKLKVRDAVVESLREEMDTIADMEAARVYLSENLPKIQQIANETLDALGVREDAVVSLCREAFDRRDYDTFSLPAGVYESLRIVIGKGAGHNWWCVVFPGFCLPATTEGFEDVAAGAGFPKTIRHTLTGEKGYEVRFFFLDALGELENIFFEG